MVMMCPAWHAIWHTMRICNAACLKCVLLRVNLQNLGEEISLAGMVVHAAWLACIEIRIALSVTSIECESSRITIRLCSILLRITTINMPQCPDNARVQAG